MTELPFAFAHPDSSTKVDNSHLVKALGAQRLGPEIELVRPLLPSIVHLLK
jgi:hypothetical protein